MAHKGDWVKFRQKPRKYPKTEQQLKVAEAGKRIAERCTGLRGKDFRACRIQVVQEVFHPTSASTSLAHLES